MVSVEQDGVIARLCGLIFVLKGGSPTVGAFPKGCFPIASASQIGFARDGHDLQIAEIAIPSNAAHVIEAEALDGISAIMISRAVVALRHRVGLKLYHAKGITSTGVRFSSSVNARTFFISDRADDGIDVFRFFHDRHPS